MNMLDLQLSKRIGPIATWATWAMVVILATLSACATQQPVARVDQDSRVRLSEYRTFNWYVAKPVVQGAIPESKQSAATTTDATPSVAPSPAAPAPAAATSLMDGRLHSAIQQTLQAKGYVFNSDAAEFRVNAVLHVAEQPKQSGMRLGLGAGSGSGNVSGGVGFSIPIGKRTESLATMTIDMIDSSRNTQVWTGSYKVVVKKPEITDAEVSAMVDIILAKYPAKQ